MEAQLMSMLILSAMTALRQDDQVARQGVMNHQSAMHLMDLAFIRDATEMSIPESYAVQGLSMAQSVREAQGQNLAAGTPKTS